MSYAPNQSPAQREVRERMRQWAQIDSRRGPRVSAMRHQRVEQEPVSVVRIGPRGQLHDKFGVFLSTEVFEWD